MVLLYTASRLRAFDLLFAGARAMAGSIDYMARVADRRDVYAAVFGASAWSVGIDAAVDRVGAGGTGHRHGAVPCGGRAEWPRILFYVVMGWMALVVVVPLRHACRRRRFCGCWRAA